MTQSEIKATWDELSPHEAFEAMEADNVDNATIAEVLGDDVAHEYGHWLYEQVK